MIFVDSNMWCYYFDQSLKEHKEVSKRLDTLLKEEKIAVNTVIVMEISHYLIKNLGPVKGKKKMGVFLSFPLEIADFGYSEMRDSIDILSEYSHTGIGGRDATILSSMRAKDTSRILTHDKVFRKIDFVDVEDPVEGDLSR